MPEEQAFGVLVEMMHSYSLRDLFRCWWREATNSRRFNFSIQGKFWAAAASFLSTWSACREETSRLVAGEGLIEKFCVIFNWPALGNDPSKNSKCLSFLRGWRTSCIKSFCICTRAALSTSGLGDAHVRQPMVSHTLLRQVPSLPSLQGSWCIHASGHRHYLPGLSQTYLSDFEHKIQVSLGLLMMVKKDLLAQDFEGIMKYFRVNIPKRLRWAALKLLRLESLELILSKGLRITPRLWWKLWWGSRLRIWPSMKRIGGGKKRLNVWQRTQLRGAKGENWRRRKRQKNKSKKETIEMDKIGWFLLT